MSRGILSVFLNVLAGTACSTTAICSITFTLYATDMKINTSERQYRRRLRLALVNLFTYNSSSVTLSNAYSFHHSVAVQKTSFVSIRP